MKATLKKKESYVVKVILITKLSYIYASCLINFIGKAPLDVAKALHHKPSNISHTKYMVFFAISCKENCFILVLLAFL